MTAEVLLVEGRVDQAAVGVSAVRPEGWTAVKVGDRLGGGVQIRTGLRSRLDLKFGDDTYVSVQRATLACISEFTKKDDAQRVRISLDYGAVRGGSKEGSLRSELRVETPVATMAKEGTEGWEVAVEPHTGRFTVSLARHGLVDAIQKLGSGRTRDRLVRPGEYANENNIAMLWLHQAEFDRTLQFYAVEGLTSSDARFVTARRTGLSVIDPGGGSQLGAFASRTVVTTPEGTVLASPPPFNRSRAEGNFGIAGTRSR